MKILIKYISLILASFSFAFLVGSMNSEIKKPKYMISDYYGQIALFKYDNKTPDDIYDIYTSSFPEEIRKKIEDGIEIYNENELQNVLEACLS